MHDRGKIDSIQVLRGIAATLVAAFHLNAAGVTSANYSGIFSYAYHGEAGVDIFFVISGFIIYYTTRLKAEQTISKFVWARFWRIMPPYWVILGFYIFLAVIYSSLYGDLSKIPTWESLLVSIFLLPYPAHIIGIAWTLSIELIFYAVFAVSYFKFGPRGFFITMIAWVVFTQIYRFNVFWEMKYLVFVLHSVVIEFLYGAVIAHLYLQGKTHFHRTSLGLGIMLMGLYFGGAFDNVSTGFGREILPGVPSALLIYGVLSWRYSIPKFLILWGESSFILYLMHLMLFSILGRVGMILFGINVYGSTACMFIMLVISILLSCLATAYIEQPYQSWYRLRLRRKSKENR